MRKLQVTLAFFILLLANAAPAFAQRATPHAAPTAGAVSYIFVSPNTREGLSAAEALRQLNSAGEVELIIGARRLTRCLGLAAVITKGLGSWADGAEQMALIKTNADEATVLYLDARLGLSARQKSVLSFRVQEAGRAKMHVLTLKPARRDLAAVARVLDGNGIAYRTLIPGRRQTSVLVVDLDDALKERVLAAARLLGGRYKALSGTGTFIGDGDSRDRAREVYREVIVGYESSRPRLSDACGLEAQGARSRRGAARPASHCPPGTNRECRGPAISRR